MTNTNNRNPYITGRSIHEPEKFFGREELFEFIRSNLNNNEKIILLYGQRRIGKSSVLKQVPHQIDLQEFVFVSCDFQEHSISSLGDILYSLAKEIAGKLSVNSDIVILYSQEEFNNNPDLFSDNFLPQIYQQLGNKNLLLLLDEFDVVSSVDQISDDRNRFFSYLHSLINREEKLFIITVLGRFKDDLQNLVSLFRNAPTEQFNLLDKKNTKKLITEPAKGMLDYQDDAIEEIWKLSSGHPCLIQYICFNLFGYLRSKQRSTVTCEDVKSIVEPTLESARGALDSLWDGLCTHEKLVFSGVAEAQKIALKKNQSVPKDPLMQLKNCGVIQTEELIQAVDQLTNKDYLYLDKEKEVRVKIEFIRRWLEKSKPLRQQIFTSLQVLEEIRKEEIDQIFTEARELYKSGEIHKEIECYEKILKLNPNHFTTLLVLAEIYFEVKNFEKALELHDRRYQIDCIRNLDCTRNKVGLLLALENYGEYLIKQGKFSQAKKQFEAVLEIEPDRKSAKDKLREIEAIIEQQQRDMKPENNKQQLQINSVILLISVGIVAIIGSIFGNIIYQSSTSCPQGKQKLNDECVTNVTALPIINDPIQGNISSGDRTLFFSIPNSYRDQGIEAFKQGNYTQAIKLFQQAITANRSDPEVRIYYNNAIARQRGNPFTLAVVVPGENGRDRAQEILRGVAQSQDQFNVNGGRDGRSLEIVIANDGDNEKQAEQIAQYLVDTSVLGVIGHGKSWTTQAALPIYKKAGMPIISPTSSANNLSGNNFFRTTPSDAGFGKKLAKCTNDSRLNTAVIVYNPKEIYSNSLREEFEKNFKGQIISKIDLRDPILNIEQELKNKDSLSQNLQAVILLPNVDHTATALDIAKVNINNKLGLKLLGGDALYNQKTLDEGGNGVEDLVLAVPWFREAPQAKVFSQTAYKLWEKDISWRTATSYDAAQAFMNSLSAQPSRETILQKLPQTNLSAKLTSGNNLEFKKGERQNEAVLVKVESGKFKYLEQCSP
ncbi:MAG: ABC transporter substrate-binding protein [Nostoc sp. EkiNYC01]|nr:ABC transporter substrate-binding protein [Nostoc sp. EkiNYC01]